MKKIILFAILMIATITYVSAQQITCGYKKIVISWDSDKEYVYDIYPDKDGCYYRQPKTMFSIHVSVMYEYYTSLSKRWITGTIPVYFVWTYTKDDYGNIGKVEKYLGTINLAELRKYKSARFFSNSSEVSAIKTAYNRYLYDVLKKDKRLRFSPPVTY